MFGKKINPRWIFLVVLFFSVVAFRAQAASFFMTPQTAEVKVGDTVVVELRVNSGDEGFNAAQATLQFPKEILNIKSLDSSPSSSIFNFWVDGPRYSNNDGSVTFIGGTTNGVVGSSIQILKLIFQAKATGSATIAMSDAAITASDGSGTNILSGVGSASINVVAGTSSTTTTNTTNNTNTTVNNTTNNTTNTNNSNTSNSESNNSNTTTNSTPQTTVEKLPQPVQIEREAVIAKEAPKDPELAVAFYPDPNKWYNLTSSFLAQWKLSPDISGVSSVVSREAKYTPPSKPEGLFESKFFPTLADGIWYLHLSLQNNKGWGPVTNYRLAIDTMPPEPFKIVSLDGEVTDNPTPTLTFDAKDALSGINKYILKVNGGEEISTSSSSIKLAVQSPGRKNILVRAIDNAGNVREGSLVLDILPLAEPTITFVNKSVFVEQGDLTISGTGLADTTIFLTLKDDKNAVYAKTDAHVGSDGNWDAKFVGPFKRGHYFVEVINQDARGASSFPVRSKEIKISPKPILILAGVGITLTWFLLLMVLILLAVIGGACVYFRRWKKQMLRRSILAQRDVFNLFNSVQKDLTNMTNNYSNGSSTAHRDAEMQFLLKNAQKKLSKAERYILDNIKEITD